MRCLISCKVTHYPVSISSPAPRSNHSPHKWLKRNTKNQLHCLSANPSWSVQEGILIFDSTGRHVCARVHLCAQAWLPSCQARPRDLAFPRNLLQSHRVYVWCSQLVLCTSFLNIVFTLFTWCQDISQIPKQFSKRNTYFILVMLHYMGLFI